MRSPTKPDTAVAAWQPTRTPAARRDPLTGLARREELDDHGPALLAHATALGRTAVLMVLDLDGFKELNDVAGHHVGDHVLAEVGRRLHEISGDHDLVVRLGGDEFAVLCTPTKAPTDTGPARAQRVIDALAEPLEVDDLTVTVGVSVGLASYGVDGTTLDELLRAADQAMYAAKEAGSRQWRASTQPGPHEESRNRQLVEDLEAGRAAQQLQLHYQPQVSMTTGEVVGFEALVRWNHPDLGLLPAREFVPLAERTGTMGPITDAVLEMALGDMVALQGHVPGARLAINVTRRHILARGLVDDLADAAQRHGLAPQDIVLEISEPLTMLSSEAHDVFASLSEGGFAVSIRGFGTARSSLTALWNNPSVREVKVDPSIVAVLDDDKTRQLVGALVSAAHSLGIRVVAQGVEDAVAAAALARLGCDVLQGYWVGVPSRLPDLGEWCASWRPQQVLALHG
ncbi:putative bifunctional diguanylate cyclase/phosphodiesterase [Nocardioides rubriscoriae]|uniref:putative bifunctional diguanylate cyclase/phosphodiesterase n=1 Tax=Nocardioides rubriscoriae TaxID=642762 RepID=UPI0011DF273F|nr:bifunctional diguanylate cyclase/phosphodiesterase [Nocardioides rubriscoriae]